MMSSFQLSVVFAVCLLASLGVSSLEVVVDDVEIGIADRDQLTALNPVKLDYPDSLSKAIEADYQQKLVMKFVLRAKSDAKLFLAHQTFVQLVNVATKQEIVFVAEPDTNSVYKFELNLQSKAKEFNFASGQYHLSLIVGDAAITNSFVWKVCDAQLTFPPHPSGEEPSPAAPASAAFVPKKEIKYLFREPEKRPPLAISNMFSVLVLVPLVLLFVLWAKLGVNISNFPISVSALVFHLGLGSIFGLFICFWLKLNMFTTVKYLAGLGLVTFLSGHGLLSGMGKKKQK